MMISLLLLIFFQPTDSLRLEVLQSSAARTWPIARQADIAHQIADLNLESIASAWLPELSLSATAQSQSDVTEISLRIPGSVAPKQSKDRFAVTLDVRQLIWDGGMASTRRELEEWSRQAETSAINVELYKLTHQLNDAFFSALILNEQRLSLEMFVADVESRLAQMDVAVSAGTSLSVQSDLLRVEALRIQQRLTDVRRHIGRAYELMSILSGMPLTGSEPLAVPRAMQSSSRPETAYFHARRAQLDAAKALSRTSRLPVVAAFGQGAVAKPGLDIFSDSFGPYFVVGVTAKWSIWDRGLSRRHISTLTLQQQSLAAQEETLSKQWALQSAQQMAEIDRLDQALHRDAEILILRQRIVDTYAKQLEQGTITATDYLTERNAAYQAEVQHRINRLLQLQAKLAFTLINGGVV